MSKPSRPSSAKKTVDLLDAMAHIRKKSEQVEHTQAHSLELANSAIEQSDALLAELEEQLEGPLSVEPVTTTLAPEPQRTPNASFDEILSEARQTQTRSAHFSDLLSTKDLHSVVEAYDAFESQWKEDRSLDQYDWMATGIVASLSVCLNLLVVGEGTHAAGRQLCNWMGAPTEHVANSPKVSFDKTLNKAFGAAGNHRWNSISHHASPAGFIHAVRDVLNQTSTHIVKGQVLVADNPTIGSLHTWEKYAADSGPVGQLLAAVRIVWGHWMSDVNTSLGLPGPMMMFAKFLEFGSITWNGETLTIAEVAQKLFESGMDMRRFIGDSIVVLLCEILVRMWFFCRAIHEKKGFKKALKAATVGPKVRKSLILVHGLSCSINAGQVYLTSNPLKINIPQWMMLGKYLLAHFGAGLFTADAMDQDHQKSWSLRMREQMLYLERLEDKVHQLPMIEVSHTEVTFL